MDIITEYLKTVKLYLPSKAKEDITQELEDELRSQVAEAGARLNRPLTESDTEDILRKFGDPVVVANRFRKRQPSLAIGHTIISPELFPYYRAILLFGALVTCCWYVYARIHDSANFPMMVVSLAIQFVSVTAITAVLDFFRRKFPKDWFDPPAAMVLTTPIAKWKSYLGLGLWSLFGGWWILLPRFPLLLLGSDGDLRFTPGFLDFSLPVFVLLVLGIAQRIVNIFRPMWTWLPPVTRLVANSGGVVICYLMIKAYPFVTVADQSLDPSYSSQLAGTYNALILYGFLATWVWIFLLVNVLTNGWLLLTFIRRNTQRSN
jgi:hypothetical protein